MLNATQPLAPHSPNPKSFLRSFHPDIKCARFDGHYPEIYPDFHRRRTPAACFVSSTTTSAAIIFIAALYRSQPRTTKRHPAGRLPH